jgi:hypothetical protein
VLTTRASRTVVEGAALAAAASTIRFSYVS